MTRVPPCLPLSDRIARAKPALEQRLLRRIPGAATIAVLLVGCTSRPVALPGPGEIVARPGRAGVVVAAPRGSSDVGTGEIAEEIARRTGFGLVVAGELDTGSEAYERRVRETSHGPLVFYVEIQGQSRRESVDRIEIATVGVDAEQAAKLRTLLELVRDAHLRARPDGSRLAVRVEPADAVVAAGFGARRSGLLRVPQRALHIELPRVARQDARELYASILADFLREAVALPLPARR